MFELINAYPMTAWGLVGLAFILVSAMAILLVKGGDIDGED